MHNRVILVSNRLPVSMVEQNGKIGFERSIGGVATALKAVFDTYDSVWVGWGGARHTPTRKQLQEAGLPPRLEPVWIDAPLLRGYYDYFSNSVLWPALHQFDLGYAQTAADWEAYQQVAQLFARTIARIVQPGDLIWIHDYHLALVPALLRAEGVTNPIGYFLHTPFPAPAYIEEVTHGCEVIDGMTSADVLGLQTVRDVENFWQLAAAPGKNAPIVVGAFPIGIDYRRYRTAAGEQPARDRIQAIRRKHANRRIIFSASRLDPSKGILTELRTVRQLMQDCAPQARRKFVYKLLVTPSRETVPGYAALKQEIAVAVDEINKSFGEDGWQPIDYSYDVFGFEDMVAWYAAADILLLLPDIDGMNLTAKEYVASRQDDRGMLVISSTIGAALQLTDAMIVEPGNSEAAAAALGMALTLPAYERAARWSQLHAAVEHEDVYGWAEDFLGALRQKS